MKVEVKENKKAEEKPFPKLMKYSDCESIILVFKIENGFAEGVLVNEPKNIRFSKTWVSDYLYDFNGTVTLSND